MVATKVISYYIEFFVNCKDCPTIEPILKYSEDFECGEIKGIKFVKVIPEIEWDMLSERFKISVLFRMAFRSYWYRRKFQKVIIPKINAEIREVIRRNYQ